MNDKKTVWVIDDDPAIAEVLFLILQNAGYDVMQKSCAKDLIDKKENFPHLVILDIMLGGENGGEVCKQLKIKEITKHIPIILISAHPDIENISKEALANSFVAKPFTMKEILTQVEQTLAA